MVDLITNTKQLDDAIRGLARTNIADKIHRIAISALYHRMQESNGFDNSRLAKLYDAVPKGVNGKALRSWMAHYCGIKFNGKDKAGNTRLKNQGDAENIAFEEAMATPFTEFKKPKQPKAFDAHKELANLYNKLDKLREQAMAEMNTDSEEYQVFMETLDAMAAAGMPEENKKAA